MILGVHRDGLCDVGTVLKLCPLVCIGHRHGRRKCPGLLFALLGSTLRIYQLGDRPVQKVPEMVGDRSVEKHLPRFFPGRLERDDEAILTQGACHPENPNRGCLFQKSHSIIVRKPEGTPLRVVGRAKPGRVAGLTVGSRMASTDCESGVTHAPTGNLTAVRHRDQRRDRNGGLAVA